MAGLIATLYELFFNVQLSKKAFAMRWPIAQMLSLIFLFLIPACGFLLFAQWADLSLLSTIALKLVFSLSSVIATFFTLSKRLNTGFHSILMT